MYFNQVGKTKLAIISADRTKRGWQAKIAKELGITRSAVSFAYKSLHIDEPIGTYPSPQKVNALIGEIRRSFVQTISPHATNRSEFARRAGLASNRDIVGQMIYDGYPHGIDAWVQALAAVGKKLIIVDADKSEVFDE